MTYLDDAIELAHSRRFTILRPFYKFTDATEVKLLSLLGLLSDSVEDLVVKGEISRELLSSVVATFLPKLKKCKLEKVSFGTESARHRKRIDAEISAVESIYLFSMAAYDVKLNLSDVSHEVIKKIRCDKDRNQDFAVEFSPRDIPTNVEQFESLVMAFAKEFSTFIVSIAIGHVNWRNSGAFMLSNAFCEALVNRLPKLVQLKVFNIADSEKFASYLVKNKELVKLEDVQLYEPFGAGELEPKKMKIQVN